MDLEGSSCVTQAVALRKGQGRGVLSRSFPQRHKDAHGRISYRDADLSTGSFVARCAARFSRKSWRKLYCWKSTTRSAVSALYSQRGTACLKKSFATPGCKLHPLVHLFFVCLLHILWDFALSDTDSMDLDLDPVVPHNGHR